MQMRMSERAVGREEVDLGREVLVDPVVVSVFGGCFASGLFGSGLIVDFAIGDVGLTMTCSAHSLDELKACV